MEGAHRGEWIGDRKLKAQKEAHRWCACTFVTETKEVAAEAAAIEIGRGPHLSMLITITVHSPVDAWG